MSIKSLALIAAVFAGTLAFEGKADAQVYYSTGYYYSPGVVTASYYSPGYYSTPYVSEYSYPSYYGSYYYPYTGAYYYDYPYYRRGPFGYGLGPRRYLW